MSNYGGSHMLNEVLCLLEEHDFFKKLDKDKTEKFIQNLAKIGDVYDCNNGEILAEIAERINVCYSCLKYSEEMDGDRCSACSGY